MRKFFKAWLMGVNMVCLIDKSDKRIIYVGGTGSVEYTLEDLPAVRRGIIGIMANSSDHRLGKYYQTILSGLYDHEMGIVTDGLIRDMGL